MHTRRLILISALLGIVALIWASRAHNPPAPSRAVTAGEKAEPQLESARQAAPQSSSRPAHAAPDSKMIDRDGPVDAAARAQFNEQAREFFARASHLPAEERLREAQRLSQELSRLERAGGLSAGEIFLVRAGLIRETVPDPVQQVAQIGALKERYENESRRRTSDASARSDPAFDSYKVREREIISEVMSMQTIPSGLSRDEYLRQRLQAAREQLTP